MSCLSFRFNNHVLRFLERGLRSPAPLGVRHLHVSTPLLGGRYTTAPRVRALEWRERLSKKARKRAKRARETAARRSEMMPAKLRGSGAAGAASASVGGGRGALSVLQLVPAARAPSIAAAAASLLPPPEVLASRSASNRAAIESIVFADAPSARARDALSLEDGDAWVNAVKRGDVESSPRNWTHAIRILGSQRRFSDAMALLSDMAAVGVPPTVHTYTALLSACAEQRNVSAAREVWGALLRDTERVGPPSDVAFGALMQAHVRGFDLRGAYDVLMQAEAAGVRLTCTLWTHLIVGLTHGGEYELAEEAWHHMRTFHEPTPDAVAFTALIVLLGKTDRVEAAINVLWDMRDSGIAPTTVTYNAVIHAAARSLRKHEEAFSLFERMDSIGLARDVRTFNALLLACSHRGEVVRARELVARMAREGLVPDLVTLNTLLTVYARALQPSVLRHVATDAQARSVRQSGAELLSLDASGALSDPHAAVEGLKPMFTGARGDSLTAARLVNPLDLSGTVERLLADYFGVPVPDDPDTEAAEEGDDDETMLQRFRPPLQDISLDVRDEDYVRTRDALVNVGLLDEGLADDIEREHSSYPSLDDNVADAEARRFERRHRERLRSYEVDALELARLEVAQRQEGGGGGGDGNGGARLLPRLVGVSGAFSEVADHVRRVTGKDVAITRGDDDVGVLAPAGRDEREEGESPRPPSSADLILSASASGQRVPMRAYLAALERELMEELYGPEYETDTDAEEGGELGEEGGGGADGSGEGGRGMTHAEAALATRTLLSSPSPASAGTATAQELPQRALRRRWVTMFGGSDGAGAEFDEDTTTLGGSTLRELLDVRSVALPPASVVNGEAPATLSGGNAFVERGQGEEEEAEYDPLALYAHITSVLQSRVQEALAREVSDRFPDLQQAKALARKAYDDPSLSESEGEGHEGGTPSGSGSSAESSHQSEGGGTQATPTPLTPEQRTRRSFAARVMARMLEAHPLGPMERSLVTAAESVGKRRQRRIEGPEEPTLMDALFAVQRLRADIDSRGGDAQESHGAVADEIGGLGPDASSSTAHARAAERHAARQSAAKAHLGLAAAADPDTSGARLEAIVNLSDSLLPGAHWMAAADYPASPTQRRAVLLFELRAIYTAEFPRARLTPDETTCNVMLSALCNAGASKSAYAFLEAEFPKHSVAPDARTFRSLVKLHALVQRKTDAAIAALDTMETTLRLPPDAQCRGMVIHALAREWRLREAITRVSEMKAAGTPCPEHFARLLRARCKAMGVQHPDVPEHPAGWQFTRAVMRKRMSGASNVQVRREWKQTLRPKRYGLS